MCKLLPNIVFLWIFGKVFAAKIQRYEPQQVHIAFGESTNEMVVTWTTFEKMDSSVKYGIEELNLRQNGNLQILSGRYFHRVALPNLKPNTTYIYSCGSDKAWSKQFYFHVPPPTDSKDWVLSVAIFGDMGVYTPHVLPLLINDTQKQMYDAIIHIGDMVYNIDEVKKADKYFDKIETVAAYVPYMTCAGNHESAGNFSHYRARFNMPGDTEGLYYSFDLGPVHFIAVHTEIYYYFKSHYQARHVLYQYQWLEKDLQEATKPENRAKRPWILVFGHRPMYCSNDVDKTPNDCRPQFASFLRKGIPAMNGYGLEDLLHSYGVDITFWGHEHDYERLWPVYDNKTIIGSVEEPYRNPKAPVHIISGAGGYYGKPDKFLKVLPDWSAFQASNWSITRMKAYNATHLYFEQVLENNVITDSFWLIKDKLSYV